MTPEPLRASAHRGGGDELRGWQFAGDHTELLRDLAQRVDIFRVEEDAAFARVVVLDHRQNVAGVTNQVLRQGLRRPRLGRRGQLRVAAGLKDLDDLGVAEPVAIPPRNRVAIHVMKENFSGLVGGFTSTTTSASWLVSRVMLI